MTFPNIHLSEYNPTSTTPALKMIIVIFWYSLTVTTAPYFNMICKFHSYILIILMAEKYNRK